MAGGLASARRAVFDFWCFPDYECDPRYLAAKEWFANFRPMAGRSYEAALSLGKSRYEEIVRAYQNLTNRADGMMRTAATVAGLEFAGAKLFHAETDWTPGVFTFCSLLSFAAAIVLSMRATIPGDRATPPNLPALFEDIEGRESEDVTALLAGAYHCAIVGVSVSNNWKARLCSASAALILVGLLLLLAILFGWS